jgi:hypothetical protein
VSYPSAAERKAVLKRLRAVCLALPDVTERLSHGAPSFFVRGKTCFLMLLDDHHGDGRFAIWCAAPDGDQQLLVDADRDTFFGRAVSPAIRRSVVVGDSVFTVSDAGVASSSLATLAAQGWAPFPQPEPAPRPVPIPGGR